MIYQEALMGDVKLQIKDSLFCSGLILEQEFTLRGWKIPELPRPFKTVSACKAYATRHLAGEKLDWVVVNP